MKIAERNAAGSRHHKKTRDKSVPRNEADGLMKHIRTLLFGSIFGVLVAAIALLGFSALLTAQDIPQMAVTPFAVASLGLGAFVSGFATARKAKEHGLIYGFVCGFFLFLIVFISGFVLFEDVRMGLTVLKLAVMTVLSSLGGVLGVNLKKKR